MTSGAHLGRARFSQPQPPIFTRSRPDAEITVPSSFQRPPGIGRDIPCAPASADDSTTIYRDEFGIPHIFAPTLADAAFAVGYAQAEDRLEELLKNYRRANGTMAEVFGPEHFQADLRQRVMRHAEISKARYEQISPKMREVIESYQHGIKQFMTDHPEQVPSWAHQDRALGRCRTRPLHHLELAPGRSR